MGDKFQNKFRISSARLQHWDYRWAAAYFITICTGKRIHYFGEVSDGKMILSNAGVLADVCWYEIPNHAANIELGEFVVMPNHIHGILVLNETPIPDDLKPYVETRHALSLPITNPTDHPGKKSIGQKRFQNPGKNSVSSIIGGYKSAVTKHAGRLGFEFEWQSRFYDHIIRDEKSFETISNYIRNNPSKWGDDKFYTND